MTMPIALRRTPALCAFLTSAALAGGTSTGLVPITELPPALYQGFEAGLYPAGSNTPPTAHADAAIDASLQVVPRNAAGEPDAAEGKIVMISIGMSNTTHEFSLFERGEDQNAGRNARLLILNTGFGGQTASTIANPAAPYWTTVTGRVAAAGASNAQVQVAWLKEANSNPTDPFPGHALTLESNLKDIARNLHDLFPNLRIVYLSSRIYGGYATGTLNPEPYAYESAYSVKWAIEDQINGDPGLNFDPDLGPVEAPVMLWGPYLWADGLTPRGDGLTWQLSDFEADGVHPAASGEAKVGLLLSQFFAADPSARAWFDARPGATLRTIDAEADAHVDSTAPDANFGSALQLQAAAGAATRRIYLRFDASSISRPVRHAKLSLRIMQSGGGPVSVASDTSWSESAITWSNAPPIDGGMVVNVPQSSRDGTLAADVTTAVNSDADGVVSFVISVPGAAQASYVSKEGGQPPRLVLALAVPPDCPGNANLDGEVNFADITFILVNFGNVYPEGNGPGDADHNGVVDFADLTAALANFGDPCP